jgi:hypothetical protein
MGNELVRDQLFDAGERLNGAVWGVGELAWLPGPKRSSGKTGVGSFFTRSVNYSDPEFSWPYRLKVRHRFFAAKEELHSI